MAKYRGNIHLGNKVKNTLQIGKGDLGNCDCGDNCGDLVPKFTVVVNAAGDTGTVTSQTTYPAGDSEGEVYAYAFESKNKVQTIESGPYALDLSDYDATAPLTIGIKVVSTEGCVNYIEKVLPAGWNREQTVVVVPPVVEEL